MQLWQGLALIIIVWTRTQMALSSDGLNLAAVVRMVIGLSIPLGMLRFYAARAAWTVARSSSGWSMINGELT